KWKDKFDKFTLDDANIIQKCDHLVLWIYNKIIGCGSDNYCISWYYGLLEKFWFESVCCNQEVKDKDKKICKNKIKKKFNFGCIKEKRDSYDFFEYYEHVNDILSPGDQIKGKYCEYIKYILKLYHEYEKELGLYKKTIDKDNTLSLLKENCNIDDSSIKAPQSFDNLNSLRGNHEKKLTKHAVPPSYGKYNQTIKNEYKIIIKELPSFKIYDVLSKDASGSEYECNNFGNLKDDKDQIKDICKKMKRNIKTLQINSEMNSLSHRDRCTYLNFWIYGEIKNIEFNKDLIKDDFNKNYKLNNQTYSTPESVKYNPCFFNYDCTFSECREMKHLFEYFKNYNEIIKKIDCNERQQDKYYNYLKYMSYIYNKHKYEEECCSWGATLCSDYFLECDEYYDPRKLISAIESHDQEECKKIKNSPIANKSEETYNINPKEENNMFIKYFTCSYVTDSILKEKRLSCQQPNFSAHLNDKLSARRNVIKRQNNTSGLDGKKITINGKTINVLLISDPDAKITGEDSAGNSKPDYLYTLFPEIMGTARKSYVKEAAEACKNGEIKEEMKEYCRKSERYKKIINLSNSQPKKVTLEKDIENWEDIVIPTDPLFINELLQNSEQNNKIINSLNSQSAKPTEVRDIENLEDNVIPADTSFPNDILQKLPFRIGVVCLATLGTIIVFFMYYKV
ncbi:CYIR protein, partial [Plasmodium cynomolgi strain B]